MVTFNDLGLNPMILQALAEINFDKPTPIQAKTIPRIINSDKDLIALAQTGTGKTAAFALSIIQQLHTSKNHVQSLILCPTRELAIQIARDIESFIKYLPETKIVAIFGGERMDKQIRVLKQNPQIVVGTPGRVNDMINRGILNVESIQWLVLDEADEMLNMGFREELDGILENMPDSKQVLLFSATMNKAVRRIANNYMRKPEDITVGIENQGADNVRHFYYVVHERDRYRALRRIADSNPNIHGIVFCRTRRETQKIADQLIQDHYSAEAIHGEISQEQRINVMNRFRDKKIQLLVATDVAARGIDVNKLTHVINYNLPESEESYVHRSGRTGRANNSGISLLIINMREQYKIKNLERKIGKSFEKGKIPSGEDICEKQLINLIDKIRNIEVNENQISKYLGLITKKFEHLSREELIKKLVSEEFNKFIEHYKDAIDINSNTNYSEKDILCGKSSILFARFKINVGRNLGLGIKELMNFINEQPGLKSVEIGNIELHNENTTFEIDERYKDKVLNAFEGINLVGVKVMINCEETGIQTTRVSGGRRRNSSSDRNRRPNRNKGQQKKGHSGNFEKSYRDKKNYGSGKKSEISYKKRGKRKRF